MISIIITSFKEPDTIGKSLKCILDKTYSGLNLDFELITIIPDEETFISAKKTIVNLKVKNWINIKDPLKGKPIAINLGLHKAKGDIILLSDGDVYFEKNAVKLLLDHFQEQNVIGVTGRPVSNDEKNNFWGYIGHLLADAAHHKRMATMVPDAKGKSLLIVSKIPNFFVLSGYILAIKKTKLIIPNDCLIEDAYISYELFNKKGKLIYEPDAKVFVKYPKNLKDWYSQKLRSVGGYIQLWKYNIIKQNTKVRNFWKELEYFWFPIKYASNLKELIFSLLLYPLRLILWIKIFWDQRIVKKDLIGINGWERIESTK